MTLLMKHITNIVNNLERSQVKEQSKYYDSFKIS